MSVMDVDAYRWGGMRHMCSAGRWAFGQPLGAERSVVGGPITATVGKRDSAQARAFMH
jgi:hypothetical protein